MGVFRLDRQRDRRHGTGARLQAGAADQLKQALAGVALAAGRGTRLGELTRFKPKPLLEVGGLTLLDHALERLAAVAPDRAVNAHYLAEQIFDHVGDRAHLSVEADLLGTAGALAALRPWIAGRDVAVTNADAWLWPNPLPAMTDDWSRATVRLSVVRAPGRGDFGPDLRYSGCCLLPAGVAAALPDGVGGLYELCWEPRLESGELELFEHPGRFFDCGTPAELAGAIASSGAAPGGSRSPDPEVSPAN